MNMYMSGLGREAKPKKTSLTCQKNESDMPKKRA